MANFKVNVTNGSTSDSVTLSPLRAWGFGSSIPPQSTVNFAFQSTPNSDTITLALMLLTDETSTIPQITGIQTDGGICQICQIQKNSKKPRLMEITNLCEQSVTDIIISGDQTAEEWLDKGIRQKL